MSQEGLDKFRRINLLCEISIGLEVHVNPWVHFFFEPGFRFPVLNLFKGSPAYMGLYSAGAKTGLRFGLLKNAN